MEKSIYDFSVADKKPVQDVDADFKPLPDGEYLLSIDYAEIKETNSGKGEQLKLELVVLESPDGFGQNRKIFMYHMIKHDNAITQEIGRGEITQLAEAVGLPLPLNIQDTSQFLNKAVRADVYTQKGTNGYQDSNKVKKYFAYQDSQNKPVNVVTPPPASEAVKDDIPF